MRAGRIIKAAVLLGALVMGGCGGGGKADDTKAAAPPQVVNYTQPATVKFSVGGKHTASFDGTADIVVLRASGIGAARVLTVGLNDMVMSKEGFRVEAFATIVGFEKDGDYKVEPPPPAGGKPALASNAYVTMFKGMTQQDVVAGRYDDVATACKVTIKQQGSEGKVECGKLVERTTSDAVTLTMTWKGKGPKNDKLQATTTTRAP
jgi:hypothetical protein